MQMLLIYVHIFLNIYIYMTSWSSPPWHWRLLHLPIPWGHNLGVILDLAPQYLTDLLHPYTLLRRLRSSNSGLLSTPTPNCEQLPPSGTLTPQKSITLHLWTTSTNYSNTTCSRGLWPQLMVLPLVLFISILFLRFTLFYFLFCPSDINKACLKI